LRPPHDLSLGRPGGRPGEANFPDGPSDESVMARQVNKLFGVTPDRPDDDGPSERAPSGPPMAVPGRSRAELLPDPLATHNDLSVGQRGRGPFEADFPDGPSKATVMTRQTVSGFRVTEPDPGYAEPSDEGRSASSAALTACNHGAPEHSIVVRARGP
jgi:hypothetical protein